MIDKKVGILGGGQLGKMLVQAGSVLGLDLYVLEKDESFPAASVCPQLVLGDFKNYDDVLNFGRQMDVVTIEIESVNIEAVKQLELEGIEVHPSSSVLEIIRDKGTQKSFYKDKGIPTSDFALYASKEDILKAIEEGSLTIPFVQKLRTGGYDGRGVCVIKTVEELDELLEGASVIEDLVSIDKEIAVLVARSAGGEVVCYDPVEMQFHSGANMLDTQIAPARISNEEKNKAIELGIGLVKSLGMTGLLAIEMFLDTDGGLLINEVAPRPHNSGHHTIEACITSQYEQCLRAILNLPLGSIDLRSQSILYNVLGEPGYQGKAKLQGTEILLGLDDVHLHWYGKEKTRDFRKMGHINILGTDLDEIANRLQIIRENLKVIS